MDIDRQLTERGLPRTTMYREAQRRRNERDTIPKRYRGPGGRALARREALEQYALAEEAALNGEDPFSFMEEAEKLDSYANTVEAPRAEPDQVVRQSVRGDGGAFL